MKITYITYKNSAIATLLSLLSQFIVCPAGGIVILISIVSCANGNFRDIIYSIIGIAVLAVGFMLIHRAEKISQNQAFEDWIINLKISGKLNDLSISIPLALALYKANPCDKTLKFIEEHNPEAADMIRGRLFQ